MPKISRQEASNLLGVHADRLRRWEEKGKIVAERTSGGHRRDVEVVIINRESSATPEQELVKDVLEIITGFSARLYGLRSHQNKSLIEELEKSAKKISET